MLMSSKSLSFFLSFFLLSANAQNFIWQNCNPLSPNIDIPLSLSFVCASMQDQPNLDFYWGFHPGGSGAPEGCFIKIDNSANNDAYQVKIKTLGGTTSGGVTNPPTETVHVIAPQACDVYFFGYIIEEDVFFRVRKMTGQLIPCTADEFINCQ